LGRVTKYRYGEGNLGDMSFKGGWRLLKGNLPCKNRAAEDTDTLMEYSVFSVDSVAIYQEWLLVSASAFEG